MIKQKQQIFRFRILFSAFHFYSRGCEDTTCQLLKVFNKENQKKLNLKFKQEENQSDENSILKFFKSHLRTNNMIFKVITYFDCKTIYNLFLVDKHIAK